MANQIYRYFSVRELACGCGCGRGQDDMDADFMRKMEQIRVTFDRPMAVNSGFRCPRHDEAVGGSGSGCHTVGKALDIATPSSEYRMWLIKIASAHSITRVGMAKDFIHMDMCGKPENKAPVAMWLYR